MQDESVISEEEVMSLAQALLDGDMDRSGPGVSEEDVQRCVRWARDARVAAALLDGLLNGRLVCWYREDGELIFSLPGRAKIKKLRRD